MTSFIINAGGLLLMGAIVWWFWLSKPTQRERPASKEGKQKSDHP